MKGIWQAMVMTSLLTIGLQAEDLPKDREWERLRVEQSEFSRKIGLMDEERDKYATALTGLAVRDILRSNASKKSLENARKLLALALHLSPRNKQALIANAQLARGQMPKEVELEYSKDGLARILITRSELLEKQGGAENILVGRFLSSVAVQLDPENEDAIYMNEIRRLDHGDVDWSKLMDVKRRPRR